MSKQKNVCLSALAYKLMDSFTLTLFGGFVRDILVPSLSKGEYPFDKEYVFPTDVEDLDAILDMESMDTLHDWYREKLLPKLREWDWMSVEIKDLRDYGDDIGIRIELEHQITEVRSHLDVVLFNSSFATDVNVNYFRFSKEKGLHLKSFSPKKILEQHTYYWKMFRLMEKIEKKACRMVMMPYHPKAPRRLIKMIRKGWTIENLNQDIQIHSEEKMDLCQICHEKKDMDVQWVELTCSKCQLCLVCFEQLLQTHLKNNNKKFPCPTCRKEIDIW